MARKAALPKTPEGLLRHFDLLTAPVNVAALIEKLGIALDQKDLEDDVSGLLLIKDGNVAIVVNAHHHPNRQRFTMAHECGHYILHHTRRDRLFLDRKYPTYEVTEPEFYARSASYATSWEEEREANVFAAELLMPRKLVEEVVRRMHLSLIDEEDVARLARAFQVSEQAMAIRLANLKILTIPQAQPKKRAANR